MYDYTYLLSHYLPMFLQGLATTAEVSFLAAILGIVIGLAGAAARRSRALPLRLAAGTYVEIVRNTPMLAQVFLVFFGLPAIGLKFSNFQAGVIALGVSGGGYLIEIMRAGFDSVPAGQREAAAAVGLSKRDTYLHVVLPQAVRIVYPPTVGQLIQMILGSSVLSVIGLTELTGQAQLINDDTFISMPTFIIALVAYLILTNALSLATAACGRILFRPPIRIRQATGPRLLRILPIRAGR